MESPPPPLEVTSKSHGEGVQYRNDDFAEEGQRRVMLFNDPEPSLRGACSHITEKYYATKGAIVTAEPVFAVTI